MGPEPFFFQQAMPLSCFPPTGWHNPNKTRPRRAHTHTETTESADTYALIHPQNSTPIHVLEIEQEKGAKQQPTSMTTMTTILVSFFLLSIFLLFQYMNSYTDRGKKTRI